MPHPTDVYVGARLREVRIWRGMTQEQLGDKLGISFQQLQKYEKGTNRIGGSRLFDLSIVLSIPVSYFFEGLKGSPIEADNISRVALLLAREIRPVSQ